MSIENELSQSPTTDNKLGYFESVAAGKIDAPDVEVRPDLALLHDDGDLLAYMECHYRLRGTFDRHYWASIPYALEQECRVGAAILRFAQHQSNLKHPLTLWCMNMAEATLARSLSELGAGCIEALANTGNHRNKDSFYSHGIPSHAQLRIASDAAVIAEFPHKFPPIFRDGFDIILEDTSFQMRSSDRFSQIQAVKPLLRESGILIMTEKFLRDEYELWEAKKDSDWKSRFFNNEAIARKKLKVLNRMTLNQVSLETLTIEAKKLFSFGIIFWNSGNFYSVAISNSLANLTRFCSMLTPPCIPNEFTTLLSVEPLFGMTADVLCYRTPNQHRSVYCLD